MKIELKDSDLDKMKDLNAKNNYGLNKEQLNKIAKDYFNAKRKKDLYKMALIEYRLTDINFHSFVGVLVNTNLKNAQKEIEIMFCE